MSEFLFIQSQDPFTEKRVAGQYDLAICLATLGNKVSVLLVQNGVAPARQGAKCRAFSELIDSPVVVLAEDFSLRQREIETEHLKHGVQVSELNIIVDAMLSSHKVIWN